MKRPGVIPALDRGLRVLEHLFAAGGPVRFSGLKRHLAPITDASLNRLLKALVASGYLLHRAPGEYALAPRAAAWSRGSLLPGVQALAEQYVERVARELNESAAFVLYDGEKIQALASRDAPDSVTILGQGAVLHFEDDHAAALVVLEQLSGAQRARALASRYSAIARPSRYRSGLAKARRPGYALDQSRTRRGVSRLAVPLRVPEGPGALYIALPSSRAQEREGDYAALLLRLKGEWEGRYGSRGGLR